jgi:Type II secretion system protein C
LKSLREELFFNKFRNLRHGKKMKYSKKTSWIFLATLIALLAAGGSMASAAPPDGKDGANQTAEEPVASNPGGVAVPVSMPVSIPRVVPRIAMDAELIGTAVVEGGTSYALFQSANGTRLVREGDEIASGVRLVQVRRNRIDVERNGIHEEIRLGWSEGSRQQVRPGSNPAGSGREARARLREDLRARGRL